MSTCISMHGEFGAHMFAPDGPRRFICSRCEVLDEDALFDALIAAEAALVDARTEIAALAESRGAERLIHAIQEQGLRETYDKAPRWDEDRIVIENGWLSGRCGRCGEKLPDDSAALAVARRDAATTALNDAADDIDEIVEAAVNAMCLVEAGHYQTASRVVRGRASMLASPEPPKKEQK